MNPAIHPEQGLREAAQQVVKDYREYETISETSVNALEAALERPQDRCPQCGNTPTSGGCALCCSQKYLMERALERPRPAPREAIHPISEAAQKVVEAYESGIIANRDAAVNDLREMLARPAPPATEPPMQCRHGAITQCRSCAGERADEIMERLAHR